MHDARRLQAFWSDPLASTSPGHAFSPADTRRPISLRRRLLQLGEAGWYWSGLAQLLPRHGSAAILMYHSIAGSDVAPYVDNAWRMSAERFERQVRFVARHRHVVSLGQLVQRLRDGKAPEPGSVALTFDDGYRDNLEIAAPILHRYGMPATLFLATAYVGYGESQWIDRLYHSFCMRQHDVCELPDASHAARSVRYDLRRADGWRGAYHEIALRLLEALPGEREGLLRELERQLSPGVKTPRLTMDWDEVRTLAAKYPEFEIGVHTAHHVDLSRLTADPIRSELEACIADVERELGARPRFFSFPYGRSSPLARHIAAAVGFECAMGPSGPWRIEERTDRYCLPRIDALMSSTQLRLHTHPRARSLSASLAGRD